jgi:hypothetical protein
MKSREGWTQKRKVIAMNGYGKVWTEERLISELFKSMKALGIDRMPTSTELKSLGRNDLHIKISRTKKYRGWAETLNLELKSSCTLTGQIHEDFIERILLDKGYSVERMSTKHPYDLLVNDAVKIDSKLANPYILRGSRVHTFGISKPEPTCDIYVCAALDEVGGIERIFVIPSHQLRVVTLCVGKQSKYNKYIDRWDYIEKYSNFLKDVA